MHGPRRQRPEGPRKRLDPAVGAGRNALKEALAAAGVLGSEDSGGQSGPARGRDAQTPLVLVACSGGPDSLALAAVTAFFARRGNLRAGAVVVDHGLHPQSAEVSAAAAAVLSELGLNPVQVRPVTVQQTGVGPEAAARTARYGALDAAAEQHQADAVLLGHTLDDQAESVLLGLARGSGTRSLSGMPPRRGRYLRPFLGLRRADTEAICAAEGLHPWHDPSNADPALMRSRVRTTVLPFLEEHLGPGVAEALSRSARILAEDANYLQESSTAVFTELARIEPGSVLLPVQELNLLPAALRHRVLAAAVLHLGADHPSRERILAAERLLAGRGSAGPVQLAGKVEVFRQLHPPDVPGQGPAYGRLMFRHSR